MSGPLNLICPANHRTIFFHDPIKYFNAALFIAIFRFYFIEKGLLNRNQNGTIVFCSSATPYKEHSEKVKQRLEDIIQSIPSHNISDASLSILTDCATILKSRKTNTTNTSSSARSEKPSGVKSTISTLQSGEPAHSHFQPADVKSEVLFWAEMWYLIGRLSLPDSEPIRLRVG